MTKQIQVIILFTIILVSCNDDKTLKHFEDGSRTYRYIEVVAREQVNGGTLNFEETPKSISAISDSAAYLVAYEWFNISLKTSKDMIEAFGKVFTTPIDFKLINNNNIDIAKTISFYEKDKIEKVISERIMSEPSEIGNSDDYLRADSTLVRKKMSKEKVNNVQAGNQSDIMQAKQFLSSLPKPSCDQSSMSVAKDGTIIIYVKCRGNGQATNGRIEIKNGIVKEVY